MERSKIKSLLSIIILSTLCITPFACEVQAISPSYDLVFETSTPDSVEWTPFLFGRQNGPRHIFGNFTITLENPENVDFVEFRVGDWNETYFSNMDLMLNDTEEPYKWTLNTLDYPEGKHKIAWEATHYNPPVEGLNVDPMLHPEYWVYVGGSITYFFSHSNRAFEHSTYNILSQIFLLLLFSISAILLVSIIKRSPKKKVRMSRFERLQVFI